MKWIWLVPLLVTAAVAQDVPPPPPKKAEEDPRKNRKFTPVLPPNTEPAALDKQATAAPAELKLVARAECTVNFNGRILRTTARQIRGRGPLKGSGLQEFDISIPGELQEWNAANGKVQFRFIPKPNGEGAFGRFSAQETVVRPMKEWTTMTSGTTVSGMSTWYLEAPARGAEIGAAPTDITMRGKVVTSTNPSLAVGAEAPVVIAPVRLAPSGEGKGMRTPPLKFQGLALWAMKDAKAEFTVTAEAKHQGKQAEMEVNGTTTVRFTLKPLPLTR